jgi:carboxymethylenebutenolidase
VLPQTVDFHNGAASIAHSKAAVHFKKHLGGPCKYKPFFFWSQLSSSAVFDLEAIWDEHTYFEFEVRSVAKTMGTMVVKSVAYLSMPLSIEMFAG